MDIQVFPIFWNKVGEIIDDGITEKEIKIICEFAEKIPENGTDALPMEILFRHQKIDLDMVVKKDYFAPDLYLFSSSSELIDLITQKHIEMCDELDV